MYVKLIFVNVIDVMYVMSIFESGNGFRRGEGSFDREGRAESEGYREVVAEGKVDMEEGHL